MENKELELLENKDIRESLMERIEVLNKVKELLLLPIGEYATTELVAQYFEVTVEVIKMQLNRNKDEFISDGYKVWKRKELQNLDSNLNLLSKRGTFAIVDKDGNEILTAPNTGLALWTPRSILRMGMLLRDSRVAKEIRNQLLNAFEVAKEKDESIITQNIDKEKQLLINIAIANNPMEQMVAVNEYKQYMERYKADAEKYTTIYNSDKLYTTTDIAKDLGMSARKLNTILYEKEIIYKKGNTWYLYSKYEHMIPEYADYKITEYGQQLKWTNKGREFIIDLLNK
jgi:phage antirepressor YoqD-like protein